MNFLIPTIKNNHRSMMLTTAKRSDTELVFLIKDEPHIYYSHQILLKPRQEFKVDAIKGGKKHRYMFMVDWLNPESISEFLQLAYNIKSIKNIDTEHYPTIWFLKQTFHLNDALLKDCDFWIHNRLIYPTILKNEVLKDIFPLYSCEELIDLCQVAPKNTKLYEILYYKIKESDYPLESLSTNFKTYYMDMNKKEIVKRFQKK